MPRFQRCFILGCSSTKPVLDEWLYTWCNHHEVWQYQCDCAPPFSLHNFPIQRLKRNQWINTANRRDVSKKKKQRLRPLPTDVVCSKHFPGGAPDDAMSPPSLELGYNADSLPEILEQLFDISFMTSTSEESVLPTPQSNIPPGSTPGAQYKSVSRACPSEKEVLEPVVRPSASGATFDIPSSSGDESAEPMPGPSSSGARMDIPSSSGDESTEPSSGTSSSGVKVDIPVTSGDELFIIPGSSASPSKSQRPLKRRLDLEREESEARHVQAKSPRSDVQHSSPSLGLHFVGRKGADAASKLLPFPSSSAEDSGSSIPRDSSAGDQSTEDTETTNSSAPPINTPREKYKIPESVEALKAEVERLKLKNELWESKYEHLKGRRSKKHGLSDPLKLLKDDSKVKLYTGFPNYETFQGFFNVLLPRAKRMRFWRAHRTPDDRKKRTYKSTPKRHGPPRQLPLISEYLMTLMRLRLGIVEEALGDMFGVSLDYCSRTLISWIKFLAIEWECLVFPPTKEEVQETLPKAFLNTPHVRYIIDGTEVFCQGSGDFYLQVLLWSNYKHHHTAKFLIGIAPNGFISFVSKAYGGRITDKEIVKTSGFYDILEHYDEVMADKGFPIQMELNGKLCTLRMPKGRRGIDQFSKEDIDQIQKVANTRIHVERAIKRIKTFALLQGEVSFSVLPQMSDIMVICAAICNTLPPLIRD